MEMDVVAHLQKERLQTLTERRSRQEDIENKKRALEDEKLNLQHFKTKVLRERWLLEGAPAGSAEEQEAVKNQLAENEQRSKQLEETIHRLEAEIDRGECEEAELKAKEKGLLQRLRDAEAAVKDAVTASATAGADEVKYVYSEVGAIPQQLLAKVAATGDSHAALMKPMSLTISVLKDPVTGETRVVSTGTVSGDATQLGGTKVFDDGRKVVYAVRSGGGGDGGGGGGGGGPAENGVPQLTEAELQEILAKSVGEAAFLQSSVPGDAAGGDAPVTMVFAGYERSSTAVGVGGVGITTEGRSDCSSEGAVRAELVMIDEEGDDVSLREKTVTDPSPADGSAAELVASSPRKCEAGGGGGSGGGPADDATEAPSSALDAGGWSHVLVQANGMSPWSGSQSDGQEVLEYSIHAESIERSTRSLSPRNELGVRPDASRAGAARQETMEGSPTHPDATSSSEPRPQLPATVAAAPSVDAAWPNGGAAATSPSPRLLNGLDFAEDTVLVAKQIMVTDDDDECDREDGAALTADVAAAGGDAQTTRARGTPPKPAARVGDETRLPGPGPLARAAGAGGRSSEARFEIKACKEERKPSKLFSDDDDDGGGHSEGGYRLCREDRRDEEKQGLEMERQALIRSQAKRSVAGSLSGGVASVARAWNPPQEATLEDTLHESQLESLRRYQERKQKQQRRWGGHAATAEQRPKTAEGTEPDAASPPYRKQVTKSVSQPAISAAVAPQPQPRVKNENVEVAPVDFAMARRQFLMMERASHLQSSLPYPIRRRASVDQSLTPQSLGSIPPSPRTASPQSPRSTSQSPIFPAHAAQRPQVSPSFIFSHASLPPSHAPGFLPAHSANAAQQQQQQLQRSPGSTPPPGSPRPPQCSARPATPEPPAVVATHATLPSPQSPGFVSLATGLLPTQFPGFALARPAKSVAEAAVQTDTEELSEERGRGGRPPATEPSRAEAAGDESEGRALERDVGVEAVVGQVASAECARSESGEREAPGKEEPEGGVRVEPVMMASVDAIKELDVENRDVADNSSQQNAQECQAGIDAESRPTASTCGDIEMDNADQTKEPTVSTEPSLKSLYDSVDNEKKIISPQGAAAGDEQCESTLGPAVLNREVGALHVTNGACDGEGKKTTGLEALLPATAASAPEAGQLPSEGDCAELPSKHSEPREEAAVLSDAQERADNAAPKSSGVNVADKPTEPPGSSTELSDGQANKEQLLDAIRQEDNTTGITCVEECMAEAAEGGNKTHVGERPEGTMCLPDGLANVELSLEKDPGSLAFPQTQDGLDDSSAKVSGEAGREDCVVGQEAVEIEIVDGEAGDDAATGDADSESDRLSESRGGSALKFSDLEEDGGGSGGGVERFADVDDGRESVEAVAAEMVRAMVAKAVEMMNATANSEDNRDGKTFEVAAAEAEWEPTTEDYTLASESSESLLAGQASLDASESADCFSGVADRESMGVIVIGSVNAVGPKGEVRVLDEALVFATGEFDSGVESVATKTPDGDNNTLGLTSTELSLASDFCDTTNETPSISADVTPDAEKMPMLFISVSDENNQIIEQEMIVSSLLDEQRKHATGRKAPSDETAEPVTRTGSVEVKASSPGFQNVNGSDESLNEDFGVDELQIEDVVKDLQDTVAFEEGRQADVERSLAQGDKRVDVVAPSVEEHTQVDPGTPSVEEVEQVNVVMPLVVAHTQVDHETPSIEEGKQVNVETPSVEECEQVNVEAPLVEEHTQVDPETPLVAEGEQVNVETPSVEEGKQVNVETPSVEEGEQVNVETPSVEDDKQVNVETPSVEEGEQVNVETPSVEDDKQVNVETPSVEEGKQVNVEAPSVEEHTQVDPETPSLAEGEQVNVETPSVEDSKQLGHETLSAAEDKRVNIETSLVEGSRQNDIAKPSVASSIEAEQSTDIDVSVQERDPVASSPEQQTPKPCADEKDQDGEEKSTDRDNEINLRKERVEMCKGNASMPDEWRKNVASPTEPGGARRGVAIVVIVENSTDPDDETNREGERPELLADAAPPDDEDGAAVGSEAAWPRDRDAAASMRELVTPPTPPPSEASVTETAVQTDAEDFPDELEGFESSLGLAYAYAAMNDFDVGAWRAANEAADRAPEAESQPADSRSAGGPGEFHEATAEVVTSATLEERQEEEVVVGEKVLRERALRQSAPEDVVSVEDRPADASAGPSENGHAAEDDEVAAAAAERGGEEHEAGEPHEDKAGGDEVDSARPAQHPQGPCFRLRPRKQNTLSMIEQEIRESQEREEELRAQRRSLYSSDDGSCPSPSPPPAASPAPDEATKGPATEAAPKPTAEASQQHKTGPGRIERVKPATARTLEEAEEQAPAESDKRGKGLMQSLVKDYDKVKLRDKKEDPLYAGILAADEVASEVVEVTRVTRRKSAKAMRWEAGIYTNHAEDED
ncbi:uncharacterized protein LOC144947680 isoform X1 [Lampetra fluviatilis]